MAWVKDGSATGTGTKPFCPGKTGIIICLRHLVLELSSLGIM